MLPFLKKTKEGSVSLPPDHITREPDGDSDAEGFDSLRVAAEDLCNAIHERDYSAAASALRAAFDLLEEEPHEEGPHTNG